MEESLHWWPHYWCWQCWRCLSVVQGSKVIDVRSRFQLTQVEFQLFYTSGIPTLLPCCQWFWLIKVNVIVEQQLIYSSWYWMNITSYQPDKLLGIQWNHDADEFRKLIVHVKGLASSKHPVLRVTAAIFDPIEFLRPLLLPFLIR